MLISYSGIKINYLKDSSLSYKYKEYLDPNYCHWEIGTSKMTNCVFIMLFHCSLRRHYTVFMKTEAGEEDFFSKIKLLQFPNFERAGRWGKTMSTNLRGKKERTIISSKNFWKSCMSVFSVLMSTYCLKYFFSEHLNLDHWYVIHSLESSVFYISSKSGMCSTPLLYYCKTL